MYILYVHTYIPYYLLIKKLEAEPNTPSEIRARYWTSELPSSRARYFGIKPNDRFFFGKPYRVVCY